MPGRWTDLRRRAERWDLLRVRHEDEDVRRRGRVLLVLAACFGVLAVVFTPASLLVPGGGVYAWCFVGLVLVYGLVIVLTRRGRVDLAVATMLASYALALVGGVLVVGAVTTAPVFALALVTLAGTLLRPQHVLVAYGAAALLVAGLPLLVGGSTAAIGFVEQVYVVTVVSLITTVAALASSTALTRALAGAREQRDRAEHLAAQLRLANDELETRVAVRTAQLHELARRDPLTGLHNRRHVDEELPRLVGAADEQDPLAVLAVDVDDFTSVNDRFGHAGGDAALTAMAGVLREVCGARGVVGRVGGEEFVVLLPATGLGAAVGTADRVRRLVSGLDWPPALAGLRLTVSVGVATATSGLGAEAVWRLADERLYAAKRAGKDRVVATDGAPVGAQRTLPAPRGA